MNPYKEIEESSFAAGPHLNYDDIATKLLKDHYFLTALELHTELVESGRELPQLREFFSNPGNFEQHVSRASEYNSMHRTPSLATLDSLDTARYSEDGGGDRGGSGGDVAVLEFELRKAKETINSLRANLTQFADGESALDSNVKDKFGQRSLKPHEKRALNFLVNEYLLLQDYKLTSITFSDENPDQDFEDWDDVGLNMPRPSGLVSLFRGDSTKSNNATSDAATEMDVQCDSEAECQTDITEESNACVSCQTTIDDTDWNHEMLIQAEQIELLKQKIIALETDKLNFQKLYDAAIVSLNSLTSPGAEGKGIELNISQDKLERVVLEEPLPSTATENHYGSSNSAHSVTPEQFEMIDSEKTVSRPKIEGSNASSFDPATLGESSVRDSPQRRSSVATLDETLSINDGGEWTRVQSDFNSMEISSKEMWIDSGLPNSLKVSILNWCCETLNINEPISNDLLAELVSRDEPITIEDLLVLVADTLPMIIPHTLVSRRCEAVALLASSIHLLEANESMRRSKLLQLLLSLLKKPAAAETRLICEAACLIVKWGGSGDVLSSIADLLTSRSSERRILASQICVSIAPYVSIELCTSLLLSLVILMCESSETEIRSLGLKAACLICPVAEHKYSQLEGILFNFLRDPVEKNVKDTVAIFVPVMARSALIAGKFTDFTSRILTNLEKSSTDKDNTNTLLHLDIMRVLVLAKLAYVVNVQIVKDYNYNNCDIDTVNYQEVPLEGYQEHFIDAQCYVDNIDVRAMLVAMNSLIKEKPDVRWSETNWFISIVKQILELSISSRSLNQASIYLLLISLFSSYVENFGPHFTFAILRPVFCDIIGDIEQRLEKIHAVNVDCMVAVGIYLVTVLPSIADAEETGAFLQKWVMYSSIRGLPIKIFSVPFKWAATHRPELLNSFMQQLREFSASSCDSASGATIREYIANLITELLNVADVAPHCVETQLLPAVVALLHDDDVSVRSSALTAWGGVTHRCVTRSLPSETRCWEALRQALERGGQGDTAPRGARETARAAEALALLILPDADSDEVNDEAVSMLCALCESAPLSAECMSALAPGLQLAAHHAANHRATLPALRKLEERMQAAQLTQYKASIEALIHNVAGTSTTAPDVSSRDMTKGDVTRAAKSDVTRHAAANLQAAQEAVGRRVTQMFQQSKTNMNLQNIFKKKT